MFEKVLDGKMLECQPGGSEPWRTVHHREAAIRGDDRGEASGADF